MTSSFIVRKDDLSLLLKVAFGIDLLAFLVAEHTLFSLTLSSLSVPLKGMSLIVILFALLLKKKIKIWVVFYSLTSIVLMLFNLIYIGYFFIVSYVVFFLKYLLLVGFSKKELSKGIVFLLRGIILLSLVVFIFFNHSVTTRGGIDFGFSNENKLPFMLATMFLISFLVEDKKIKIERTGLFLCLLYASFVAGSRTSILVLLVFGLVFFTLHYVPFLKKMRFFVPVFMVALTFFTSLKVYDDVLINIVLASRPLNWNKFLKEEEFKLVPSQLKISEYKNGLSDVEFRRRVGVGDSRAYFFDNAYINIIYRCGGILSFIILVLVSIAFFINNSTSYTAVGVSLLTQMFTESAIFLPLGGIVIWLVYGLATKR